MFKKAIDGSSDSPPGRVYGWLVATWVFCGWPSLATHTLAAPPEVVRIRMPASKVAGWFGPGTELRMIEADRLESLLASARQGGDARDAGRYARLLRARHQASWKKEEGILVGRSELVVAVPQSGTSILELVPWTPSISGIPREGRTVAADGSGRAVIELRAGAIGKSPANVTVAVDWVLSARPGALGRRFELGLPGDATTEFSLDMPAGSIPLGLRAHRQGSLTSSSPGRQTWRFRGPIETVDLQILDSRRDMMQGGPTLWVNGPTTIDLGPNSGLAGKVGNWRTVWSVQLDPRGANQLVAVLDQGLDLINVSGPDVVSFQTSPENHGTRVIVTFSAAAAKTTTITYDAHVRAPAEGRWRVPAIRPLGAVWTGGSTTIRLGESRCLRDCIERAGRRIGTNSRGIGGADRSGPELVFEARSPDSVADLVLVGPKIVNSCTVRGLLIIGPSPPRLECHLTGLGAHGPAPELEIELPPNWVPDRVQWNGMEESLDWHTTVGTDGRTRLQLLLPDVEGPIASRRLVIGATSTIAGGRGPLSLPRVRPATLAVADEVWVANVHPDMTFNPVSARGLAWLDPERLEAMPSDPARTYERRNVLAWRWNAEVAEAKAERERMNDPPRAEIRSRSTLDPTGLGLVIDGQIIVTLGDEPLSSLPVWISDRLGGSKDWSFKMEIDGEELTRRELNVDAQVASGFPRTGTAWELTLGTSRADRAKIRFHAELPWSSGQPIPVLLTPGRFMPRGTLLLDVPNSLRSQVRMKGLHRLDPSVAERTAISWDREAGEASGGTPPQVSQSPAHAFTYSGPGSLVLTTEELTSGREDGVIRDASLTTVLHPQGPSINRLRLLLGSDRLEALRLSMPPETALVRVQLDGTDIAPVSEFGRISIGLPAAGAAQRPRIVDITYEVRGEAIHSGVPVRPVLPRIGLPCLSFCWELVVPPHWRAAARGSDFVASDGAPSRKWPLGPLGIPSTSWTRGKYAAPSPSESLLRRLDEAVLSMMAGEPTFAEWFTRWDSVKTPVVVDRLALASLGHGPQSRCAPAGQGPGKPGIALKTLERYGLDLILVENSLVITSMAEASRARPSEVHQRAVTEAVAWGSDRSDRFQAVSRWRGEATPREVPGGWGAEPTRSPPGWSTWKHTAAAWPDESAFVVILQERSWIVPGWMVAVAVLAGLCSATTRGRRRPLIVPLVVMCLSVLCHLWLRPSLDWATAGAFAGALPVLLLRLGILAGRKSLQERPVWQGPRRYGSGPLRSSLRPISVFLCLMIALEDRLEAMRPDGTAIQVLLPYDGILNPTEKPSRAIIRESDYERLRELAQPSVPGDDTQLLLIAATHRVSWIGDREALVWSELVLRNPTRSIGTWNIPVSGAKEISATLDGRPAPVFVDGSGRRAAIQIPGEGDHEVRLRRTVNLISDGERDTVDFPVNPMPSARLVVAAPRFPIEALVARGNLTTNPDRSIAAELGPAERVEIRFRGPRGEGPRAPSGNLEGNALWDIEPAGDDLRCRFTYRGARRLSTLSFRIEPGLILRKIEIPGIIDQAREGTPEEPIIAVRIDPPLDDGAEIALEAWRPTGPEEAKSPGRLCPLLDPVGFEGVNGLLGVRRPGDWTGRLEGDAETLPLDDENFVRAWGALPDDRLTLAGTVRLDFKRLPNLRTGPAVSRGEIKPTTHLRIEPGRIELLFEAELDELTGPSDHLRVELPEGLKVLEVESEGMTDWSLPAARRLLIRYDRPRPTSKRRLRVTGWIPVHEEPFRFGPRTQRFPTPWPRLAGMGSSAGLLIISSAARVETIDGRGITPVPPGAAAMAGVGDSRTRQIFLVTDPSKLGELRWSTPVPRVRVLTESQITIRADLAEWVAVLQYEVAGGASESIHLKVPTPWAARAQVELGDDRLHRTEDVRGPYTIWNVSSDRPIWGTRRLVVRSSIPLAVGQDVEHPQITPLGFGVADTYLGVVNATSTRLMFGGSSGLHEITYPGRFLADEFSHLPALETKAYRVDRDNWSLRVQLPPSVESGSDSPDPSARVVSADLSVTVMPDRKVVGSASYEVQPGTGRYLVTELPPDSRLSWATLENSPVEPLRSTEGRWLIPISGQGRIRRRVCLFWSQPPASGSPATWSITLPRAGAGRVSTLVTLRLPDEVEIRTSLGGLELTGPDRVELERADRLARQVLEIVGQMGRNSMPDRDRIVPLLVAHELALREADRSSRWNARNGEGVRRERAERDLELIQASRNALAESLRESGFESEYAVAEAVLKDPTTASSTTRTLLSEPAGVARIRSLGRPTYLIGLSAGLEEDATVILGNVESKTPEAEIPDRARAILMLGSLAALCAIAIPRARSGRRVLLILAGVLGVVAFATGPVVLVMSAILAGLGWSKWLSPPAENEGNRSESSLRPAIAR